jgi:hypothetical protein
MGEEFYSIIKLVSGEEIFSLISIDENREDPIIIAQNPIIMKIIHNDVRTFIKVKPWIEMSDEDIFIIRLSSVITMSETNDERLIKIYNDYISEESNQYEFNTSSGKVGVSTQMGYISSVESARKKLEDLFKNNKES